MQILLWSSNNIFQMCRIHFLKVFVEKQKTTTENEATVYNKLLWSKYPYKSYRGQEIDCSRHFTTPFCVTIPSLPPHAFSTLIFMEIINRLLYPLTSSWASEGHGWKISEAEMFLLPTPCLLGHWILGVSSTEGEFLSCLYSSSLCILESTPSRPPY